MQRTCQTSAQRGLKSASRTWQMRSPELQHLRVRFRGSLHETLAAYLRGSIDETAG